MSSNLNLTINETLNNLQDNINTLTTTLSNMNVDSQITEINNLLSGLENKINTILQLYNDVYILQEKVDNVKS